MIIYRNFTLWQIVIMGSIFFMMVFFSSASDESSSYSFLRRVRKSVPGQNAHRSRDESLKEMEDGDVINERSLYHGPIERTGRIGGAGGASVPTPVALFPAPDNVTKQVTFLAGFGILFQRINYVTSKTTKLGGMHTVYIILIEFIFLNGIDRGDSRECALLSPY